MGPEDLAQVLKAIPRSRDGRILASLGEDACAFQLGTDLAVVQTVDFITPVVDDAATFGAIAAANALSDIYAMGAVPVFALNITTFPVRTLPLGTLEAILAGGAAAVKEAGISILGGHTVDDPTPKYGLSVTGVVDPRHLVRTSGGQPGDHLVLTKPLGIGVLTTALDHEIAGDEVRDRVVPVMTRLNRTAAEAMQAVGVNACTDVTGFGLLGHLREMASQSGLSARVYAAAVPVLEGAIELAAQGAISRGTHNNYRSLRDRVRWSGELGESSRLILCDAQTSGGLLMAVPPGKLDALLAALSSTGDEAAVVGKLTEGPAGHISVAP